MRQLLSKLRFRVVKRISSVKKEVQGRWGRVATRCAAIAERDEDSRREDDIIMHKDYDLSPDMREKRH